jgi:hypothetical protein
MHLGLAIRAMLDGDDFDIRPSHDVGRARAASGVPLSALMEATRVLSNLLWQALAEEVERRGDASRSALVAATADVWLAQAIFADALAGGWRDETDARLVTHEHERSALVEALFQGRVVEPATIWEIADLLHLSPHGPFVVVAAELAAVGRHALVDIEARLRLAGVASAWRLQPAMQVGIVRLPAPAWVEPLATMLGAGSRVRQGISPVFDDLAGTPDALRFARIALAASPPSTPNVVVFDEAALSVAAVGAPDVMDRVATMVLGPVLALPATDRDVLLETLDAWFALGGSVAEVAKRVFCHPNTVRHRLRRVERFTGRSLADPRQLTELCLALEAHQRRPR